MGFPRENLYRACLPGAEVRAAEGGGMPTLFGHFSVFNTPALISSSREGTFIERVAPGAFAKSIRENRDQIKVMFNHGRDPQIGEKPLGKLDDLREDKIGGYYEVGMSDTSYNRNDLVPLLRDGLLGASFRFSVMREAVVNSPKRSAANPDGIPERTIQEARLYELGPVVAGAYKEATAGVRSITDTIYDVDALGFAGAIIMDDERLGHARAFISRGIESDAEPSLKTTKFGISDTAYVEVGHAEPTRDALEARVEELRAELGALEESLAAAVEAELVTPVPDTAGERSDEDTEQEVTTDAVSERSDVEDEQDAPPDDSAEPSLAHPIRGRRDTPKKSYLRKETPKWQL